MLDLKALRENPDHYKKGIAKKQRNPKLIDQVLKLDEEYREIITKTEKIRSIDNKVAEAIGKNPKLREQMSKKESDRAIMVAEAEARLNKTDDVPEEILEWIGKTEGRKDEKKALNEKKLKAEEKLNALLIDLPNPPLDSVPEGEDETGNQVIRTEGKKPEFDFEPLDHVALGKKHDLIEIEKAVEMSGTRFYYLKNEAVQLEFALVQFALKKLSEKGFSPVIPPVLVKENAMFATGFFPADRNEIYHVNPDEDDLYLVGTSEVSLAMLHAGEIMDPEKLPRKYCGFSTCFRREAGSYGKDTHGILRVHQFDKIEMFIFCQPEESAAMHEKILSLEEEIMQDLGFHYQVVNICGGDLGAPAAKKYDLEAWIPSQNKFRELTSCSNCTDFQARRANIRYRTDQGNQIIHTLNGTTVAVGRTLIAILENNQNKDGSINIPKVLQDYVGKKKIG